MQPTPSVSPAYSIAQYLTNEADHFAACVYWPSMPARARALWGMAYELRSAYADTLAAGWPWPGSFLADAEIMVAQEPQSPLGTMQQRLLPNPPAFPNGLPWSPGWKQDAYPKGPNDPMPAGAFKATTSPAAYGVADDLIVTIDPRGSIAVKSPNPDDPTGPGAAWWPKEGDETQLLSVFVPGREKEVFQKLGCVGAVGNTGATSVLWLRLR